MYLEITLLIYFIKYTFYFPFFRMTPVSSSSSLTTLVKLQFCTATELRWVVWPAQFLLNTYHSTVWFLHLTYLRCRSKMC